MRDQNVKEAEKCEASGDLAGAIVGYSKAIEMSTRKDKPDYMLHYKRACAYQKTGAMEKAAEDFRIFLSADDRALRASSLWGAIDSATIAWQRGTGKIFLAEQTFGGILNTYNFDVGYSNAQFYEWEVPFGKSRAMLKENPQEANYRMGVARLLQRKHEDAIKHLDKAIEMNSEDARSYLFRGITHSLQIDKRGLFGPSRSAKELSKTKAISDLERVIALKQSDSLTQQANRWKTSIMRESPTPPA